MSEEVTPQAPTFEEALGLAGFLKPERLHQIADYLLGVQQIAGFRNEGVAALKAKREAEAELRSIRAQIADDLQRARTAREEREATEADYGGLKRQRAALKEAIALLKAEYANLEQSLATLKAKCTTLVQC